MAIGKQVNGAQKQTETMYTIMCYVYHHMNKMRIKVDSILECILQLLVNLATIVIKSKLALLNWLHTDNLE